MLKTVNSSRTFSDELLDRYRQQGDPPADAVIEAVAHHHGREGVGELMRWLANTAELDGSEQHPAVQEFLRAYAPLPEWADRRQMERAMQFFQQNIVNICLILGYYSLPYCYAGADGARVLWFSERVRNDTQKRLEETVEWVFNIMKKRNWATGKAVVGTLKVRLMHAAIRWFTLHRGNWNFDWGYPINQEDMAGTNLAFSYIVIRGMRRAGLAMTEEEEEAYLHHINVTGYLLGVSDDLLARNRREAFHIDRAIVRRQFRSSEQGQGLTRSLLQTFENLSPAPLRNLPAAQMRFFLGDELADALAVPAVPLEKRLVGVVNSLPIFSKLIGNNL
ncbi:oxygenase MpaB family protein [Larkinella insperata]|uniref:Oxygenase MpaB family protein n=1 Tax=Larkinella insperata TaxID=332158 RepID=A0ABW3QIU7_9BACT|nr:oxygenase MpaB family protein [Larkinella insperata]